MLITLSHQDVLILVFGTLQFRAPLHDFILRGSTVETGYNLTFVNVLAHLYAEHDNLLVDAAGNGHL